MIAQQIWFGEFERNMNKYERNTWEIQIAMGCTTNMVEKYESAPGLEPICGRTKAIWGQKWNADVCKIFGWKYPKNLGNIDHCIRHI